MTTLEKLNKRMDLLNRMAEASNEDLGWAVAEWRKLDEAKRAVVAAEAQAKKVLEAA
tara:strand:- start:253 stop:423 length:171 start_codon:yes stop_codon:yes gene_type:complete